MGIWSKASRTHVAHMDKGDFFSSDQSATMKDATDMSIEHVAPDGTVTVFSGEQSGATTTCCSVSPVAFLCLSPTKFRALFSSHCSCKLER